jgi:hypothetical protein
MNQQSFKFFWPLEEQIPLDLDYTGCDTRPFITFLPGANSTGSITLTNYSNDYPSVLKIGSGKHNIEITPGVSFAVETKPNSVKQFFMKYLLGWIVK